MTIIRCQWYQGDPLLEEYHDHDWGKQVVTNEELFEALTLEVFQSGLSWRTVLHKRERFHHVFHGFSPAKVASFTDENIEKLLADEGIIRHRKKIEATIKNAKIVQGLIEEFGSFRTWIDQLENDQESKVKKLGATFRYVGPTTATSYFEAIGEWRPKHDETCDWFEGT